jgi:hypothetical protein
MPPARDAWSWRAFFGRLAGSPEVVVADLDPAISRAVHDTWPGAIVIASRHHVAAQIRERARADGIAERVRLDAPVPTLRPLPWTGEPVRRFGPHPLHEAALPALRGPASWAAFLALVERHVLPDRLALRSWIATNEPLVRRGWLVHDRLPDVPLSTGGQRRRHRRVAGAAAATGRALAERPPPRPRPRAADPAGPG